MELIDDLHDNCIVVVARSCIVPIRLLILYKRSMEGHLGIAAADRRWSRIQQNCLLAHHMYSSVHQLERVVAAGLEHSQVDQMDLLVHHELPAGHDLSCP